MPQQTNSAGATSSLLDEQRHFNYEAISNTCASSVPGGEPDASRASELDPSRISGWFAFTNDEAPGSVQGDPREDKGLAPGNGPGTCGGTPSLHASGVRLRLNNDKSGVRVVSTYRANPLYHVRGLCSLWRRARVCSGSAWHRQVRIVNLFAHEERPAPVCVRLALNMTWHTCARTYAATVQSSLDVDGLASPDAPLAAGLKMTSTAPTTVVKEEVRVTFF